MEVEKTPREIIFNLTREEIFSLQAGKTVYGGRPGVILPDAKADVSPLSIINPFDRVTDKERFANDRLKKATEAPLSGYLWSNGDLEIFVPAIKLTDVRLASARLPKKGIITPEGEGLKIFVERVIPEEGIKLNFGGSLKTVHVLDFFV
jgi:hypothetical protein